MNGEKIFLVRTETSAIVFCPTCNGTGNEYQKAYHNKLIKQVCSTCKGSGKKTIKHSTETPLLEALIELKLIKKNK